VQPTWRRRRHFHNPPVCNPPVCCNDTFGSGTLIGASRLRDVEVAADLPREEIVNLAVARDTG
jgi:hypothetical protein